MSKKKSSPKAKTKITRIKAGQTSKSAAKKPTTKKVVAKKVAPNNTKTKKAGKKGRRPISAFNNYLKMSWRELRQVKWPSRKATWSMTFAVIIYAALMLAIVLILDNLFNWLIKLAV